MSSAPPRIVELVETFERNIESYKGQGYSEAQVRQQFINPFFEALGWDMQNKAGIAPAYSDVIHEDAIKVGAPDYCFRIGGTRKFFLEAKKPSVDISSGVSPAYQLRRYAWSTKLPLSILTDFEDFAVYDCQIRPNINDKPSTARIFFCTYKNYADKWEQIASIFSKEAVLKGAFDKYASEKTTKRGTTTVDKEFLAEIEGWRNELAKNIALRNNKLSVYDLNFAVQKTIDRILFLRICEDRGIERSEQLSGLINGSRIYPRLFELFEKADEKYNSGIFHFRREKDRPEGPDEISANLKVDDDVLKKIIKDLYYPCPYVFSEMPVEILGNVYEQFLGKVIRLTAGHQAKVEEKPEVKKAGGVYYTPSYIVDYIVKNTVGKLCEDKTPKQIEKLKILDPACGSGSFLIGAYQYLLDFHRDYYAKEPSKYKKVIYQGKGKQWFLTIDEKKRILLNNIYGVDIDSQAAEVTKLSLLLKVLENETQESLRLFHERALPDLGNNIKCGNSLIGPDFYQNQQLGLFGDEQQRKINAFDWQKGFSPIFKQGGFDTVIGNPPYGASLNSNEKTFLANKYTCQSYQLDSYLLFLEKSISSLLCKNGLLGMIFPNPWLTNLQQDSTRRFIVKNCSLKEILHFKFKVFKGATVDTQIVILENRKQKHNIVKVKIIEELQENKEQFNCLEVIEHNQNEWELLDGGVINIFLSKYEKGLLAKIKQQKFVLENFFDINVGVKPYQKGKGKPSQTEQVVKSRPFDATYAKNKTFRQYLRGKDIVKYAILPKEKRFISYGVWLAEPRPAANFDAPTKIFMRQTGDSLVAAMDKSKFLCLNNMHVLVPKDNDIAIEYFLGLLNSKLLNFYYQGLNPEIGEALAEVKKENVAQLPIRNIDFPKPDEVKKHDKIVSLVEEMLELHKKINTIKNPNEKTRIQRQIDSTDEQIDKLVYDLYGLSADEIAIVEGKDK
jgi:type I restriction-modification system DNA methylase subunit